MIVLRFGGGPDAECFEIGAHSFHVDHRGHCKRMNSKISYCLWKRPIQVDREKKARTTSSDNNAACRSSTAIAGLQERTHTGRWSDSRKDDGRQSPDRSWPIRTKHDRSTEHATEIDTSGLPEVAAAERDPMAAPVALVLSEPRRAATELAGSRILSSRSNLPT